MFSINYKFNFKLIKHNVVIVIEKRTSIAFTQSETKQLDFIAIERDKIISHHKCTNYASSSALKT